MSKGIDREITPIRELNVPQVTGALSAEGLRFAIVAARFNNTLTDALVQSAVDAIKQCGGVESALQVIRVPGAYEIPVTLEKLLYAHSFDAVIALGVVVEENCLRR